MATQTTQVQDRPERSRFEAIVDGEIAGFAAYTLDGDVVTFTHTEVDDAFEGRGVGGTLVRQALDDVRSRGRSVRAQCPFVKSYIDKHPQYQDLLAG